MRRALSLVASLVLLAGCSSQGSEGSATPEPGADWPLTGLASADSAVDVDTPALVVKVDNVAEALPQQGLDSADVVVEEPVEGGVTRLAVFYQSSVPSSVGPVRSVRSSDIGIVQPAQGVLVASGGAPEALADLDAAGVVTALDGSAPGFSRDESRPAPHNLFVDSEELVTSLDEPGPPGPFFEFGSPDEWPDGQLVEGIDITFSDKHTTQFDLADGTWTRRLGTADGFAADTVIVLGVQQGTAGYLDPSGAPVPINITEGEGFGWIAHGDQLVEIEWQKESAEGQWTFSTAEGAVPVAPGRTYLALISNETGSIGVR
jgi:hypothetical protein